MLSDQMLQVQNELDRLNNLPATKTMDERRDALVRQLDGLNGNFESLATKLQSEDFFLEKEGESKWLRELEGLMLPLLEAVGSVTAKPRRIEILKKRVEGLETQLKLFEIGRKNIEQLMQMSTKDLDPSKPRTQFYLDSLKRLDNKYNVEIIRVKLDEARRNLAAEMEDSESLWDTLSRATKNFLKHRGLNLLITIAVFVGLWFSLTVLRTYVVGDKSIIEFPGWMQKLLVTVYSVFALLICFISSLITLYLLNDWLLLSIIILFLVAVAWASREFIPRLFQEVRFALNLGTVREHERLIWNGVPWEVESLGLQASLVNHRLEGGAVQLPLAELFGKFSRPVVEDEPWFPTEIGDWVILADGTYGQVERQTVEQTILRLKGDTLKYYTTPEFLTQTPMNLSQGFRYNLDFRLDYGVQSRIADEIPKLFEEGLRKYLAAHYQEESPDFTFTDISFDRADSSALKIKIIVHAAGRCADRYEEIEREIQTALVRICNDHNLTIPFSQLTLTLPENFKPKPQP
ncbi:MAG: hypothetical protein GWM98_14390 [Nitrospinaceae bacterium]|nr:mechanosensitive ion channel family protein [Nitrospinaceae bacterium]NIR55444.1 mechanosensitive ion channel family protein [Nitrospinaceae bacterium]NIS85884.1 mechanosensitive ion channel family protein [Nitrospinaceae bacterium]NIT82728.1 mechanosensitive ion channel family protein [Nitrospinaceae bacterium]NIU44937.1 mechanosensitive ion channel family protein [Nitrospinaceae bacterium]